MLPRHTRLSRREVSSLLKSNQRFSLPEFTIFSLQAPDFKISVIVPTSLYKKSSARNRLRRAVYHQLQNISFASFPRVHWLVILKTAAKNLSPQQLSPHIMKFLIGPQSGDPQSSASTQTKLASPTCPPSPHPQSPHPS